MNHPRPSATIILVKRTQVFPRFPLWNGAAGYKLGFGHLMSDTKPTSMSQMWYPSDPGDMSVFRYDDGLGFDDLLYIGHRPAPYGVTTPDITFTNGLSNGDVVQFVVDPAARRADGYAGTYAGYAVYAFTNNVEDLLESRTATSYDYVHPGFTCKFVWKWTAPYFVRVSCTVPDGGGSVALAPAADAGFYEVGSTVTLTATPNAGHAFYKWTGDVPAAQQFQNPLVLDVSANPHAITAVFSTGRYVTPEGAGAKTGESWENAFASLQDAIDASATGGTIYLATGVHTNAQSSTNEFSLCVITNQSWLAIRGGYAGTGTPGPRGGETVLHNAPGSLRRLLRARNIDLRLDGIVFDGGRISGDHGGGLYLQNSTLAMTNCTIRDCRVTRQYEGRGGGLYLATGSLRLADCAIIGNRLEFTAHSFYYSYGGGIAITGAVTTDVARCTFDNNWIYTPYRIAQGGAIHVSGGIADIRDSLFTTNYVHIDKNYSDGRAWGAAVCAVNMTRLNIADCRLIDNLAHGMTAGGAIFLGASNYIGPTSKGTGIVERCAITAPSVAAIKRPYTGAVNTRDLYAGIGVGAGYLFMTNVVIASDARGAMLRIQGGSTELSRCTLVGGGGYAAYVSGGNLKLTRCIVDDFASGLFTIDGGFFDADYSCIPSLEGVTGLGNTTDAPLLSTDGYYHALSRAGYYDGGFFGGGAWRYDATATSPSIDMAPLSDPYALEPQPNGHRANVGYDAGLPVASRSDLGEPPVASALAVYAYPPVDVEAVTAVARGEVGGPEGVETSADVTLVWGPADAGTASVDDWASKCSLGTHINWELFAEMISNAGANTYYRFYAENADGSAWSEPVVSYASVRLPVVTGESVTHITRHEATANWTLADDGDRETAVSFLYWKDGSTVTSTVPYGVCAEGVALSRIWELEAETTYGWLLEAKNVAGTVRTAPATFTTHSTAPAVRYVTPAGAGICDGSDWANAFSNLQEAVDFCRY